MHKPKKNNSIGERGSITALTKRMANLEREIEGLKRQLATADVSPLGDEDVPLAVLDAIEEGREEFRSGRYRPAEQLLAELKERKEP